MKLRAKTKNILNHIPLWMQLAVFTTAITFTVLFYLVYNDYQRTSQVIADTQAATSSRLLTMEMQNLENYVQELALFCIQSCYDQTYSNIVEKTVPILPDETTYIKNQLRAYYYSRDDIISYDFYLMNQNKCFSRTREGIRTNPFSANTLKGSYSYTGCLESPYFHAILPGYTDEVLFQYSHFLLRIKTKEPLALVTVTVADNYWDTLSGNHSTPGEFICLFNQDNQLLHSGNPDLTGSGSALFSPSIYELASGDSIRYTFNGKEYLVTCAEGENYHMRLLAFLPVSHMDTQIAQLRDSILFSGLLIGVGVVLLITVLIRLLTNPLIILAKKLVNVGNGDFTSTANISGSHEISLLSHSFNHMIQHIDRLIKKNYIAELNEKTARITALEAQLNPHFLYNTLQAISTEALLNDQTKIYDMITSLASSLRYTIKGGDYVPLHQEMQYVENYILLQKMRMDERLKVTLHIEDATRELMIPKISIQSLVENSILHGIGPDRDSISIEILSQLKGNYLYLTIKDDGCGIDEAHLSSIMQSFRSNTSSRNNIGLANLYGRLHLLYQEKADIKIETREGSYTMITLMIPATKEVPHV